MYSLDADRYLIEALLYGLSIVLYWGKNLANLTFFGYGKN